MENAGIADIFDEISTDAHEPAHLELMRFRVDVARRGWLGRANIANTRTVGQQREALRRR